MLLIEWCRLKDSFQHWLIGNCSISAGGLEEYRVPERCDVSLMGNSMKAVVSFLEVGGDHGRSGRKLVETGCEDGERFRGFGN